MLVRIVPVVHCKRESYDVYIGRPGPWGNPFRLRAEDERGATLDRYRAWLWEGIVNGDITLQSLAALHGKTLGCWCAPRPCHGDVLSAAAAWAHDALRLYEGRTP